LSGKHIADKFKFSYCTTDYRELLNDPEIDLVFILTRHNSHARFVIESLKAGKNVYVEKPLCLTIQELNDISEFYESRVTSHESRVLMVGFNRRFSPTAARARNFIGINGPSSIIQIRCNAGFIPKNSWVHHPEEGGGRIIAEVCHFVDLAQYLTGGLPKTVFAACSESSQETRDNLCTTMKMDNGAAVTITYASNGDRSFPREEVQVFAGGGVFIIHNFKNAEQADAGKKKKWKSLEVDRGYKNELKETLDAIRRGGPSPIDFRSLLATTFTTFAIEESVRTGKSVEIKNISNAE
jgi:polar amino acid transport system substrate-binding protein